MPIKLMVLGHARSGKDSVCNLLRDMYGLRHISSSLFAAEKAVRPWLAAKGITYPDLDTMYDDRVNHRADWHDAIADYNKVDPGRLGRELFEKFDIYAGIRNPLEFNQLKKEGIFDAAIWVDAHKRVPDEPWSSNKMRRHHADYILDNNEEEQYLRGKVMAAYNWALVFSANK